MRRTSVMLAVLSAVTLSGCGETATDRVLTSTFTPNSNGTWEMTTTGQPINKSEQDRLNWIADYMQMNHLCPNGYDVTNRRVVVSDNTIFGDIGNIYYEGRCKS